jgi:capsular polysaccharide biosynthesis protein
MTNAPFRRDTNAELVTSIDAMTFLRGKVQELAKGCAHSGQERSNRRRRLYFSRRNTQQKRLVNEGDLLPILKALGFDILDPAHLEISEQIALINEAEVVCGPIGAATSMSIFGPRTCKVIELIGDKRNFGAFNSVISSALIGQPYGRVYGERVWLSDNKNPEPIYADFTLDIGAFEKFLKEIL